MELNAINEGEQTPLFEDQGSVDDKNNPFASWSNNPNRSLKALGYACAFLSMFFNSTSLCFAQALGGYVPEFELNLWRYACQFVIITPLVVWKRFNIRPQWDHLPWLGLLCLAYNTGSITYYGASVYIPAGTLGCVCPSLVIVLVASVTCFITRGCKMFVTVSVILCITGMVLITQPRVLFSSHLPNARMTFTYKPICIRPSTVTELKTSTAADNKLKTVTGTKSSILHSGDTMHEIKHSNATNPNSVTEIQPSIVAEASKQSTRTTTKLGNLNTVTEPQNSNEQNMVTELFSHIKSETLTGTLGHSESSIFSGDFNGKNNTLAEALSQNYTLVHGTDLMNNDTREVMPGMKQSHHRRVGRHLSETRGYIYVVIASAALSVIYMLPGKRLQGSNPFVTMFYIAISGVVMSSLMTVLLEELTMPRSSCLLLLLGHSLCTVIGTVFTQVSVMLIPAVVFSLAQTLQLLVLFIAQYTVLSHLNPGNHNVVEVVGVLIVFLGNVTGSFYKLYEDVIKKSKDKDEIPLIE